MAAAARAAVTGGKLTREGALQVALSALEFTSLGAKYCNSKYLVHRHDDVACLAASYCLWLFFYIAHILLLEVFVI